MICPFHPGSCSFPRSGATSLAYGLQHSGRLLLKMFSIFPAALWHLKRNHSTLPVSLRDGEPSQNLGRSASIRAGRDISHCLTEGMEAP